jgi:chromosome segregation and condensation protein ScpB
MSQLGLDGRETTHPVRQPRPLTPQQREVLAFVARVRLVKPIEITERFDVSGFGMLSRLRRRGLVERSARGTYRVVVHDEAWAS